MTTGTRGMKEDTLVLYLSLLPLDKLALITIIELMRQAGSHGVADGMKSLRGFLAVGKAIETEYRAETIKTVAGVDSPQWLRTLDPQTQKPTRQLVGSVWRKLGKQLDQPDGERQVMDTETEEDLRAVWTPAWSQMTQLGLGSYLVDALLQVAKVDRTAMDPATGERM
jgi:DNA-directed RNA polymerase